MYAYLVDDLPLPGRTAEMPRFTYHVQYHNDQTVRTLESYTNKKDAIGYARHLSGGYFNRGAWYVVINKCTNVVVWESRH